MMSCTRKFVGVEVLYPTVEGFVHSTIMTPVVTFLTCWTLGLDALPSAYAEADVKISS